MADVLEWIEEEVIDECPQQLKISGNKCKFC